MYGLVTFEGGSGRQPIHVDPKLLRKRDIKDQHLWIFDDYNIPEEKDNLV